MILIGLTGARQIGKSTLAEHLVAEHGFGSMHPFDGGKKALEAWFHHIGASPDIAYRMVHGDLKDQPSALLPLDETGQHYAPRFIQEKFGAFMGVTMGPEWTFSKELRRLTASGFSKVICQSIVFEEAAFREAGGVVILIEGPRRSEARGVETDRFVSSIIPDLVFRNEAANVQDARAAFSDFLVENGLLDPAPDDFCPFELA